MKTKWNSLDTRRASSQSSVSPSSWGFQVFFLILSHYSKKNQLHCNERHGFVCHWRYAREDDVETCKRKPWSQQISALTCVGNAACLRVCCGIIRQSRVTKAIIGTKSFLFWSHNSKILEQSLIRISLLEARVASSFLLYKPSQHYCRLSETLSFVFHKNVSWDLCRNLRPSTFLKSSHHSCSPTSSHKFFHVPCCCSKSNLISVDTASSFKAKDQDETSRMFIWNSSDWFLD